MLSGCLRCVFLSGYVVCVYPSGKGFIITRLEGACLSTEEITEYFLPSWYYTAVDRETIFTWAVQGLPEMDHLHIITPLEIEESVPANTCTFPSGAAA